MANKNIKIQQNNGEGYDTLFPHTLGGIVELTGYTKPASTSAVSEEDSVNTAIGKLEKGLDDVVYEHPATHSADIITNGTTNKVFTATEQTKLGAIAENANNYSHPTGDGNLHVPATGTTNSGKVLTAGATAGSLSWTTPTGGSSVTVEDVLTSTSSVNALSAKQGKVLNDLVSTISGKRTVRFVIGTSTAGWTAADCDYLCDGTADDVEINNAITALPATGGEIVILDGTYNITAKINVTKNNVSIRGNGNATILKRMFDSSVIEGVITLTSRSGCKIADLQVDGRRVSYDNNNNNGIYLSNSSNNTVTCNNCNNNNNSGIYLNSSSNNNTVTGNTCNNSDVGIYLVSSSSNTISGNTYNNNNSVMSLSPGIYLSNSSNNTITGNNYNNNNYGIYSVSSSNNTITGNNCNNNKCGIYLNSSSNNTVTGNTFIRGTGLVADYTASQYTIRLKGTANNYNLIAINNCMGKAVTNEGGTGNTLVNNKFDAT